jgi:hypothetical protein
MTTEPEYTVTVRDLIEFVTDLKGTGFSFRVARPNPWVSDPKKPTITIEGLGAVDVRGGSMRYLVIHLTLDQLKAAKPETGLTSPDFGTIEPPAIVVPTPAL